MPEYMNAIWYLSLLTIGVGFLAGRGGVFFIIGGFVCYWFLAPMLNSADLFPTGDRWHRDHRSGTICGCSSSARSASAC